MSRSRIGFPGRGPATPAASKPGMNLDPTADIHPSVILEGKVAVDAFTGIDMCGNVNIEAGRPAKAGGSKAQTPGRSIIADGGATNVAGRSRTTVSPRTSRRSRRG
jgi:hypothetical protein